MVWIKVNRLDDKRGQVLILMLMFAIVIIIVALAIAPAIIESATIARDTTNLNCTNPAGTAFDKVNCIAVDMTPFYFIGIMVFIAGAIITAKIIGG